MRGGKEFESALRPQQIKMRLETWAKPVRGNDYYPGKKEAYIYKWKGKNRFRLYYPKSPPPVLGMRYPSNYGYSFYEAKILERETGGSTIKKRSAILRALKHSLIICGIFLSFILLSNTSNISDGTIEIWPLICKTMGRIIPIALIFGSIYWIACVYERPEYDDMILKFINDHLLA